MLCVESQTQKSIFWVINSQFWNLGAHLNDQTVDLERSLLDLHTMFSQLLHTLSRECFLHPASSLYFNSSFSVVQNFDIDLSESAKRSSSLGHLNSNSRITFVASGVCTNKEHHLRTTLLYCFKKGRSTCYGFIN